MKKSAVFAGLAALGAAVSVPAQTVRRVPVDYPSIQQAIDASLPGDTVRVSPGEYFERLDMGARRITLESSDGPESTIIDATFLGPVLRIGAGATRQTVVQGLTLTHGRHDTTAGGIVITDASPTIQRNVIIANQGGSDGNGITAYNSSALIQFNRIAANVNSGLSWGTGWIGAGGIYLAGWRCVKEPAICAAEVRSNTIEDNAANSFTLGGGLSISGGMPRIVGNVIRRNSARSFGGGIAVFNDHAAHIENNLIIDNRLLTGGEGAGIVFSTGLNSRGPYIINNTLAGNHTSGKFASALFGEVNVPSVRLANNLVIAVAGSTAIDCVGESTPLLASNNAVADSGFSYAGLCAAASGQQGNIAVPPQFLAPDDYRLTSGSAGVDAGTSAYSSEPLDIALGARIVATVDIGAYELADGLFADGFAP